MTIVTSLSALRILVHAYVDIDAAAAATTSASSSSASYHSMTEEEMSKFHRLYKAMMSIKLTFLFGTFTLLCAWSLTSLLFFHAMIVSISQTTNERVRNVYRASSSINRRRRYFSWCGKPPSGSTEEAAEEQQQNGQQQQNSGGSSITGAENEADQGCCPNWYKAFCSPIPVSRLPRDMSATVICQYTNTGASRMSGREETVWTGGEEAA